ncbi:MAG: hypothetical protein AAFY57_11245 [Cyanobacteria bacterium J06642_2]
METQPLSTKHQNERAFPPIIAIAAFTGLLAGVGVALYLQTLPTDIAVSHATIALAAAGAVYAGSGLARNLKASAVLEIAIALGFILVATLGTIHSLLSPLPSNVGILRCAPLLMWLSTLVCGS